jgi:hypothetical protein
MRDDGDDGDVLDWQVPGEGDHQANGDQEFGCCDADFLDLHSTTEASCNSMVSGC